MEFRTAQKTGRALTRLALVISVSVSNVWATQNPANRGTIEVTVVVRDSGGALSYIPAARVRISGPTVEEGTTDGQGRYPFKAGLKARAGIGIFNAFNHFNPRDVQTNLESTQFGGFFNNAWREYRGKFVVEF